MAKKIYIKAEKSVELPKEEVLLTDIAKVTGNDSVFIAKIRTLRLHRFHADSNKHCVISIMKVIELIQQMDTDADVQIVGVTDTVVEYRPFGSNKQKNEIWKIVLVTAITFFGTSFTIMAFHNDIGIRQVFERMYEICGQTPSLAGTLEISYSIGLALGITLFFNHVGKKNITTDPTPIEVEMRVYEDDINMTWVQDASRKGEEIDVM